MANGKKEKLVWSDMTLDENYSTTFKLGLTSD